MQIPLITIYGTTADNASFLVQDAGVGVPQEQFTRIVRIPSYPFQSFLLRFLFVGIGGGATTRDLGRGFWEAKDVLEILELTRRLM